MLGPAPFPLFSFSPFTNYQPSHRRTEDGLSRVVASRQRASASRPPGGTCLLLVVLGRLAFGLSAGLGLLEGLFLRLGRCVGLGDLPAVFEILALLAPFYSYH